MAQGEDRTKAPQIEHTVEEIWDGDSLEQRYDFLDYHFEQGGAYLRARAYLNEMETVTLFGPFEARGSITKVRAVDAQRAAMTYLQHRYVLVKRI